MRVSRAIWVIRAFRIRVIIVIRFIRESNGFLTGIGTASMEEEVTDLEELKRHNNHRAENYRISKK